MSLAKYKAKRNFTQSPEPTGGNAERDSLLKSRAIPKGPSTDPSVKRLAVLVEDHPYDYRNFEGVIPTGYGAGTVMIWDAGYYTPVNLKEADKNIQDKQLRKDLKAGKLSITLFGKKLKGDFELVRFKNQAKQNWLLIKIRDRYSNTDDITERDKSVVSKKTLGQIEKANLKAKNEKD